MIDAIILDIDGVLNTESFIRAYFFIFETAQKKNSNMPFRITCRDDYGQLFDPVTVAALKMIIEKTGAKIVISSTWRFSGLSTMKELWEYRQLPGEIVDITPHFRRPSPEESVTRGEEIQHWISQNSVRNYVIIDDDSDMLDSQMKNFVQTDPMYGLTFEKAQQAIHILQKDAS